LPAIKLTHAIDQANFSLGDYAAGFIDFFGGLFLAPIDRADLNGCAGSNP